MAIADTITSMQTHTSDAYTMIGYGTDLTGINKNLENLYPSIFNAFLESLRNPDTLFTNLPKITGSGSNITLNDTANAPMRIELGASELTQDGTPTPSSPQDIHTISGSNKVVVSNGNGNSQEADIDLGVHNLLNSLYYHTANSSVYSNGTTYVFEEDGSITLNGTATAQNSTNIYNNGFNATTIKIPLDKTKTYTIINSNSKSGLSVYARAINNGTLTSLVCSGSSYSFTGQEGITEFYVQVANGTQLNNVNIQLMIIEGSTVKPYTQYGKNIEYCKIGNYEDKFIRTSGKNLFDINKVINGTSVINNNNGTLTITATSSSTSVPAGTPNTLKDYCPNLQVGDVVYLNATTTATGTNNRIYLLGSNESWYFGNSRTITQNDLNSVVYWYANGLSTTATISDIIISKENVPYEPYGTDEWYIKKNIPDYTFTGNEYFDLGASAPSGSVQFLTSKPSNMFTETGSSSLSKILCNRFVNQDTVNGMRIGSYISFFPSTDLNITTTADFKTWLSTNNVKIKYVANTPTYTQITGTLAEQLEYVYKNMLSQKGQTNISQVNNDLSFELDVEAIEDIE